LANTKLNDAQRREIAEQLLATWKASDVLTQRLVARQLEALGFRIKVRNVSEPQGEGTVIVQEYELDGPYSPPPLKLAARDAQLDDIYPPDEHPFAVEFKPPADPSDEQESKP